FSRELSSRVNALLLSTTSGTSARSTLRTKPGKNGSVCGDRLRLQVKSPLKPRCSERAMMLRFSDVAYERRNDDPSTSQLTTGFALGVRLLNRSPTRVASEPASRRPLRWSVWTSLCDRNVG